MAKVLVVGVKSYSFKNQDGQNIEGTKDVIISTTCVIALCKIGSKEPTMSTPVLSIITTS